MEDEEMESPEMSQCFTSTGDNTTGDCEPRTFQRSPEPVAECGLPDLGRSASFPAVSIFLIILVMVDLEGAEDSKCFDH
ncbi:hypothetical protein LAZ67_14001961 [Cordylochernes scorpioides]|uniref:Uncharacterized protein n=1 Tax=Cordylochernes scorpioides TaxID=51811 RepID=A0ABY6L945_9ARAC|nr:hypothetical protein LAZ67_14001961 [Cordylochernes scorpioides]